MPRIVKAMRDICSDVADGVNPVQDPLNKGTKDAVSGYKVTLGQKHIGPSTTQVRASTTLQRANKFESRNLSHIK